MFHLDSTSRIFIVCPAGVRTGGPHSLHQLCGRLRDVGHDASLVYVRSAEVRDALIQGRPWTTCIVREPTAPSYPEYAIRQADAIEDDPRHVLIVPERAPEMAEAFSRIQKAIWWLSTQAAPISRSAGPPDACHLCQSVAVADLLRARGLDNVFMLESYAVLRPTGAPKRPQVAFNPAKGHELTSRIVACAPDVTFVPLAGMTDDAIASTLSESMLYIDFGHHPGRDRLPREAVLAGCALLVANTGTVAVFADMPIPRRYKIDPADADPRAIADRIRVMLRRFPHDLGDFQMFRRLVEDERARFERHVHILFGPSASAPSAGDRAGGTLDHAEVGVLTVQAMVVAGRPDQ
jgi:hypothetical protein